MGGAPAVTEIPQRPWQRQWGEGSMELELLIDDSQPGDSPGCATSAAKSPPNNTGARGCRRTVLTGSARTVLNAASAFEPRWTGASGHCTRSTEPTPFWQGTNGLASLHKLEGSASRPVERGENSVEAAWLWIAVGLVFGSDYLNLEVWKISSTRTGS